MIKELEIKGYWWTPHEKDKRIPGTLSFSPTRGAILELIGSFKTSLEFVNYVMPENNNTIEIIHGESPQGKSITLLNCMSFGSVNFNCSFAMEKLRVGFIIHGMHLKKKNDEAFNALQVSIPFLTQWVNKYMLRYSIPFKNNDFFGFNLEYDLDKTNKVIVEFDPDFKIELEYTCTAPSSTYEEELIIGQKYLLKVVSRRSVTYSWLLEKAERFKTFLTLCTLTNLHFNSLSLFSDDGDYDLVNNKKYYYPIELLYPQRDEIGLRKKSKNEFLISYDRIETDFTAVITKWYSFDTKFMPILKHLIESIKEKCVFGTADFLIVVQALEGFSCRFRKLEPDKRGKIFLKTRIENLWNEFLNIPYFKNTFLDVNLIVESRHYYSHFYLSKKPVAEGKPLYDITQILKKLLLCCVLKETGISDEKLLVLMSKNVF